MKSAVRLSLILAAVPAALLAYGTRIHNLLPSHALAGRGLTASVSVPHDTLPGITDADVAAFRAWLWQRAASLRDSVTRRAFLARYPDSASFTPRALKELLMMDGSARVLGIDSFAAVYRELRPVDRRADPHPDYLAGTPLPLRTALELGSIYPDLDRRNQSRLLRAADGTPRLTSTGDSIPFDPMSLNMGRLTGLSSQAHGHYGLNRRPKSAEPSTLKREPWNFAAAVGFPGPVETYAADNAQLYTDLALLAALGPRPGWRGLGAIYAGNAMHYLADVGNAVHTIQVGIYPIFVDATIQSYIRKATTLFGLIGTPKSRNAIGIDIVSNLHTLSERLFEVELTNALRQKESLHADSVPRSMDAALTALALGNDSLTRVIGDTLARLHRAGGFPDFGRAVAEVTIEANMRDGAEVYRVTRDIIATPLRIGRITVDFDTVPDERVWHYIRVHRGAVLHTELDDFNAVHARGIGRTTSALRAWWNEFNAEVAAPAPRTPPADFIVARLISERLRYLEQAEARRAEWIRLHGAPR